MDWLTHLYRLGVLTPPFGQVTGKLWQFIGSMVDFRCRCARNQAAKFTVYPISPGGKKNLKLQLNNSFKRPVIYSSYRSRTVLRPTGSLSAVSRATSHFVRLIRDDKGATAIEYVVIGSVLGLALIPVLASTSSGVASLYTRVLGYANIINGS